jgi:two-component system sensor histidine kinase/response regulator
MVNRNTRLPRQLIFTVGSGFVLALLLIGALTLLGLHQVAQSNAHLEAIVQENSVKTRMANQMRDILRDRAISMLSIVVMSDPFERDQEMLRFYGYGSAYQKVRLELGKIISLPREKEVLANIDRLTRLNQPVMVRTVDLGVDGYTFLAFEVLQNEALPLQHKLVKELDALIQIQRDMTQQATQEAHSNYIETRGLMILLGLLAVAVAAAVALAVVRRTARLAAVTELERTKYQTLFETNTDGIVILDQQGFIDCNPATLKMFHMGSKAEFLACPPDKLGHDPQSCGTAAGFLAEQQIQQAIAAGHAFFEWVAQRPDGTTFPTQIDLHAMTLDGRKVIQAIMRDVSAQKESEDTLRRARDAALSATEMKSQFVANVSHEIRTPMNGIMGMTQLLQATPLAPRQKDYADAISRSANALMTVINDLLDFSKIEAGRLTLEDISFDLGTLLRDILELYVPRADAKQLALRLERSDALPSWVHGDPLRIRQILLNLLDNAIKFTSQGEVRLLVEPAQGSPGQIRFSVRDTGQGMSPEVQAKVFQAFSQADGSVSRKFGGTGLGLTICRQLAELMGGSLTLESTPGVGSTFHLTLPLPAAKPVQQTPAGAEPVLRFPGVRVLVAEDNQVNQKLMRYMLENLGCDTLLAEDGKLAYERLLQERQAQRPLDLVLMDVQMPEWDGLTATQAIRAWEQEQDLPRLPILALTANAMSGFAETCHQAGMDDVLTKPLREEDLTSTLARWLPGRSQEEPEHLAAPAPASHAKAAPPISASTAHLFQLHKIVKLCHNNPAQVEETLKLFLSSTEPLLDALSQAVQAEDSQLAARQAHQIKGAAAYMGAESMTQHASATERYAKAGDWAACTESMEELESAFIGLRLEIEEEIKRIPRG